MLLLERSRSDPQLYRFTLLNQGTSLFNEAMLRTGGRKYGLLQGGSLPISEMDLQSAAQEISALTSAPFEPFEEDAPLQTASRRIARSRAFRTAVIAAYGDHCAMCSQGARIPGGISEIEAAHVISRSQKGSDDVRNGLALCRLHHWAFDRHLIGFTAAGDLRVHPSVVGLAENAAIAAVDGLKPAKPADQSKAVDAAAVAWAVKKYDDFWSSKP